MVRNYVRKTTKGVGQQYTEEDLAQAISDVKDGKLSTHGAANTYSIPRTTLRHYLKGTRGVKGKISCTDTEGGGGGVNSYLSETDEKDLANVIRILDKVGYGLTKKEVLDLVEQHLTSNQIKNRFKNNRPGWDWFLNFRKRHYLSIKKPQSIEHARTDSVNPWVIYDYFDVLEEVMIDLDLLDKPWLIFNCDETPFNHDPGKTKSVGAVGTISFRKTSSSGRENTTVLMCCSASGVMMPPLCVFKGKYVLENWVENAKISTTAVAVTDRGWMETLLFFNWFKNHFLNNIPAERPILLIYDGHTSHISLDLITLARKNQIVIMKLPPHTTHVLQPLDVGVFSSLKLRWDEALVKWQRRNPRKKIPKNEFAALITEIVNQTPAQHMINAFATTGIYDAEQEGTNRFAIDTDIFESSQFERYIEQKSQKNPENVSLLPEDTEVVTLDLTVLNEAPDNVEFVTIASASPNASTEAVTAPSVLPAVTVIAQGDTPAESVIALPDTPNVTQTTPSFTPDVSVTASPDVSPAVTPTDPSGTPPEASVSASPDVSPAVTPTDPLGTPPAVATTSYAPAVALIRPPAAPTVSYNKTLSNTPAVLATVSSVPQNLEKERVATTSISAIHQNKDKTPNTVNQSPNHPNTPVSSAKLSPRKRPSFEDTVLNFLKVEQPQNDQIKRKRLVKNCEIITTETYLKQREAQEQAKEAALQKKKTSKVGRQKTEEREKNQSNGSGM